MRSAPISPAALAFDDAGVPFSAQYQDIYHPRAGALLQARRVFLNGNGLPERWRGRERFVLLELGFGLGNNFLACWEAWREDPQRCERLVYLSIEAHPLTREQLARAHAASPLPDLAAALQRAWPPLTANLHTLDFDGGAVQLMLALGDVQAWLPELDARVDAFLLDGFAPINNPRMWDARVCKALGRLAAPGASLATWSAARALRANLAAAGFDVRRAAGTGGKRDITLASYAPAFTPRRAASRTGAGVGVEPHALIVGAGLAGCAVAWSLARQGWRSTLFDRRATIASEASGNPAGLFHGIVTTPDSVHARFNRAAALAARDAVQIAIDDHGVAGAVDGLLRLEIAAAPAAMRSALQALGLLHDYVEALDAVQASERVGIALRHPGWFYRGGGWVGPGGLARSWLERAAPFAEVRCDATVHALQRSERGWRLVDATGATLGEAPTVVLANAGDALRLLGLPDWPIDAVRGQISLLPASQLPSPRIPLTGAGYLLPPIDGYTMFGATAHKGDGDATVRDDDHRANLVRLAELVGHRLDIDPGALRGRTAWRASAIDRLPLIGAVPDAAAAAARLDQPRFVPRLPGLFVMTALGSRGITWSALGAQLLAALITGAPAPVEASLIDAVDPARFVSRKARRSVNR